MRLIVDKFKIRTQKNLTQKKKIILISDTHIGNNFLIMDCFNLKSLLKSLKNIQHVDFFALCGDYINSATDLTSSRARNNLFWFIGELAKQAPVVMVRGNHDLYNSTANTEEIYQALGKIKNVILLDNAQRDIAGISVTGFMPRHEAYDLIKHGKRSHRITIEDFEAQNFTFDERKFNLILTHSPYSLTNKRAMRHIPDVYEKCDLVLSGHLHNGLFPSTNIGIMRWILRNSHITDLGIWIDPKTGFVSRHCRGARFVGDNKIEKTILPRSGEYTEIDSSVRPHQLLQITGKGINKFSVLPFVIGCPSVVEVVIQPTSEK